LTAATVEPDLEHGHRRRGNRIVGPDG